MPLNTNWQVIEIISTDRTSSLELVPITVLTERHRLEHLSPDYRLTIKDDVVQLTATLRFWESRLSVDEFFTIGELMAFRDSLNALLAREDGSHTLLGYQRHLELTVVAAVRGAFAAEVAIPASTEAEERRRSLTQGKSHWSISAVLSMGRDEIQHILLGLCENIEIALKYCDEDYGPFPEYPEITGP